MSEFNDLIQTNPKVIVVFHADWCGPCKQYDKVLSSLGEKDLNGTILKVINADDETYDDVIGDYNIKSLPTTLIFKDGKVANRFSGYRTFDEVKNLINETFS